MKSVPRTPIVALGVLILTFCLYRLAICPDAYLTVPRLALIDNEPMSFAGSYTNSSITSLDCSVISTLVSSMKSIRIVPLAVTAVSILCTPTPASPSITTSLPLSSTPEPLICPISPTLANAKVGYKNIAMNQRISHSA